MAKRRVTAWAVEAVVMVERSVMVSMLVASKKRMVMPMKTMAVSMK